MQDVKNLRFMAVDMQRRTATRRDDLLENCVGAPRLCRLDLERAAIRQDSNGTSLSGCMDDGNSSLG